jgi:hypothetical protein
MTSMSLIEPVIINSKADNLESISQALTGYLHPGYAESLAEFGIPRELPRCGGWILERQIPGFSDHDAMGCYPLFLCQDWSQLHADLEDIGTDLVSLVLVTDPFGTYDPAYLRQCFRDVVIPFKDHFIVDLQYPLNKIVSKYNRKNSRKALKNLYVEKCQEPTQHLEEWLVLYNTLIDRHNIRGIRAFSKLTFVKQLSLPGIIMFRALFKDTTVGAHLWYVQGEVAYSHLSAYNSLGYDLRASYALQWFAIEYFADKVRWLNQGAGIKHDGTDGLSQFKRDWSTGTRTVYLCGRIFNQKRYVEIVKSKGLPETNYFPAYRQGEFN